MDTKICKTCVGSFPLSDFYQCKKKTQGVESECKTCFKARGERARIKRLFGLTLEQVDTLIAEQGGCAICGKDTETDKRKTRLCIDHDHKTGKVRGILCDSCNKGLGSFRDNPSLLRIAAMYLENPTDETEVSEPQLSNR